MSDGTTDYITRREFDATTKYYDRALSDMARTANDRATEVKDELRRLGESIKSAQASPPPEMMSMAAALHRGVEALEKTKGGGNGGVRWVAFAVIAASLAYVYHLSVGHW